MKYFDKNYSKWQKRQESIRNQPESYQIERANRKTLDQFALRHIRDKEWWKVLSWDERRKVYRSYQNTFDVAKSKFKGEDTETYWYSYDPDVAEITGDTWEECVPQWVEYVQNKYPIDANVRRELAIRRIFS